MNVCPWQPAAIQSNRGTKLIEILRLSHKGNREIKSNVYPLARITNKLERPIVRCPPWRSCPRVCEINSRFSASFEPPSLPPGLNPKFETRARRSAKFSQNEKLWRKRIHEIQFWIRNFLFYALVEEKSFKIRQIQSSLFGFMYLKLFIWVYLWNTSPGPPIFESN